MAFWEEMALPSVVMGPRDLAPLALDARMRACEFIRLDCAGCKWGWRWRAGAGLLCFQWVGGVKYFGLGCDRRLGRARNGTRIWKEAVTEQGDFLSGLYSFV